MNAGSDSVRLVDATVFIQTEIFFPSNIGSAGAVNDRTVQIANAPTTTPNPANIITRRLMLVIFIRVQRLFQKRHRRGKALAQGKANLRGLPWVSNAT